jgi:hypothetical protein
MLSSSNNLLFSHWALDDDARRSYRYSVVSGFETMSVPVAPKSLLRSMIRLGIAATVLL